MGWWKWRVHIDEKATQRNSGKPVLQYCQGVECPQDHYGYEPFVGRHPEVLAKWDFVLDSDGKVGK